MTLQPKCEDVETAEGVAITVTGVAQKMPDYLLATVMPMFFSSVISYMHADNEPSVWS
ncbi:hypothetical protein PAMP_007385 [Pampus punctatissimus]